MTKKEATKTLTWEESWGKVNWKTLTIQQLYKLLENGADPFMVGKDGKGRIGLPINFLIWERDLHFNLGLPYDGSLDDRLPLTKKAQPVSYLFFKMCDSLRNHNSLVEEAVERVVSKYDYNEQRELKKTKWKELNWYFVSPNVIREMLKKGLNLNASIALRGERPGWTDFVASPTWLACLAGNVHALKAFAEAGADLTQAVTKKAMWNSFFNPAAADIDTFNCLKDLGANTHPGADLNEENIRKIGEKRRYYQKIIEDKMWQRKPLTLVLKEAALDKASEKARKAREDRIAEELAAGNSLAEIDVTKERKDENNARLAAYKGVLRQKYRGVRIK